MDGHVLVHGHVHQHQPLITESNHLYSTSVSLTITIIIFLLDCLFTYSCSYNIIQYLISDFSWTFLSQAQGWRHVC